MAQAYEMAVDALGLALTSRENEHQPLPSPSDPTEIIPELDAFLVVIEFDMLAYKKRNNSRAVKKTLSIPEWLNEAAIAMDINFLRCCRKRFLQKFRFKSKTGPLRQQRAGPHRSHSRRMMQS